MKKGLKYSIWVVVIIVGIFFLSSLSYGTDMAGLIGKRTLQWGLIMGGSYLGLKLFRKKKKQHTNSTKLARG